MVVRIGNSAHSVAITYHFRCFIHIHPDFPRAYYLHSLFPISQMRELRHHEGKPLAHTAISSDRAGCRLKVSKYKSAQEGNRGSKGQGLALSQWVGWPLSPP